MDIVTDNERLEKRLTILSQVNSILKLCHCSNAHIKQSCEHCVKLIPLGEELLKLTKPRKIIKSDGNLTLGDVKERPFRCKSRSFTIEDYVQAKLSGSTDAQFAIEMSMSATKLYKWKTSNIIEIKHLKNKLKVK